MNKVQKNITHEPDFLPVKRKKTARPPNEMSSASSSSTSTPTMEKRKSVNDRVLDRQSTIHLSMLEIDDILSKVLNHSITVISADISREKSTLLPKLLYQAGYGSKYKLITVSVTRKVHAILLSRLLADELQMSKNFVSYELLSGGNVTTETKIVFMTNSKLLDELKTDHLLTKYAAVCVDNIQERKLDIDIIIGILSRVVRIREKQKDPLKVILMSAVRMDELQTNTDLFKTKPAVIDIPSALFNVDTHYFDEIPEDFIESAFQKVVEIHTKMPPGGILVFLPQPDDIETLVNRLNSKFTKIADVNKLRVVTFHPNQTGTPELDNLLKNLASTTGKRLCILSTDVAESYLPTINIRYVVDSGKTIREVWNQRTGVSKFVNVWCSREEVDERSKIAGMKEPGHCYRLFSMDMYQSVLEQRTTAEILFHPLDRVIMYMRSIELRNVCSFPFLNHPGQNEMARMEEMLFDLKALENSRNGRIPKRLSFEKDKCVISELGGFLFQFPLNIQFARILDLSFQHSIPVIVIAVIAALSVENPLLPSNEATSNETKSRWTQLRRSWVVNKNYLLLGDIMILLQAIILFENGNGSRKSCNQNGLRYETMMEISTLRKRLTKQINDIVVGSLNRPAIPLDLKQISEKEVDKLRYIILIGRPYFVAKRMDTGKLSKKGKKSYFYAYWSREQDNPVFIHPSSVLHNRSPPDWVVYQHADKLGDKMYIKIITAVDALWIAPKNLTEKMDVEMFFYGLTNTKFNDMLETFLPPLETVCNGMLLKGMNANNEIVLIFPAGLINLYTSNIKFVEARSSNFGGHDWIIDERKAICRELQEADKIFLTYYTFMTHPIPTNKHYAAYIEPEDRVKINGMNNQQYTHSTTLYFEKKSGTCYRIDSKNVKTIDSKNGKTIDSKNVKTNCELEEKNFQAIKNFINRTLKLTYGHKTIVLEQSRINDICALTGVNSIIQLYNKEMDIKTFDPLFELIKLLRQTLDEVSCVGKEIGGVVPTIQFLERVNAKRQAEWDAEESDIE